MAAAEQLLQVPGQTVLDLDVSTSAPVRGLLDPPARTLFSEPPPKRDEHPPRAGAARVVDTSSRVLFEAVAGVYDELGFDTRR